MALGTRKAVLLKQTTTEDQSRMTEFGVSILEEMRRLREEFRREIRKVSGDLKEVKKEMGNIGSQLENITRDMKEMGAKIEGLQERTEKLEKITPELEKRLIGAEDQVRNVEIKLRERCLKIRGLVEENEEDLTSRLIPPLAKFINWSPEQLDLEVDKLFQVNSFVAKKRKVPRDIVIYFLRDRVKELILQQSYEKRLKVEGQELMVFKDVPAQILRKRKEYFALTTQLKTIGIKYRWAKTEGVIFTFQSKKYTVNSPLKANEFIRKYRDELKSYKIESSISTGKGNGDEKWTVSEKKKTNKHSKQEEHSEDKDLKEPELSDNESRSENQLNLTQERRLERLKDKSGSAEEVQVEEEGIQEEDLEEEDQRVQDPGEEEIIEEGKDIPEEEED